MTKETPILHAIYALAIAHEDLGVPASQPLYLHPAVIDQIKNEIAKVRLTLFTVPDPYKPRYMELFGLRILPKVGE